MNESFVSSNMEQDKNESNGSSLLNVATLDDSGRMSIDGGESHVESNPSLPVERTDEAASTGTSTSNGHGQRDAPVASSSGFNRSNRHTLFNNDYQPNHGGANNAYSSNRAWNDRRGFNQRRNLKSIEDEEIDVDVLHARQEEEDRLNRLWEAHQRQRQQLLQNQQQMQLQLQQTVPSEEIVLSSDDEGNSLSIPQTKVNHHNPTSMHYAASSTRPQPERFQSTDKKPSIHAETIDLSGGEDEGGMGKSNYATYQRLIMDREQSMMNGTKEIPENGLHTDDTLNTKDAYGRVLVNVAHPDNEPDVLLSPHLSSIVKPHQIGGVRFLYDCLVESIEKFRTTAGMGCILAHSMGLGKTLQTIAFTEVFLRVTGAKHVLCIVPVNTLQNWLSEFDQWLPRKPLLVTEAFESELREEEAASRSCDEQPTNMGSKYRSFAIFSLGDCKTQADRVRELMRWRKEGGVLFLGYEMYRIMLDEAHLLSNINRCGSALSSEKCAELMAKIRTVLLDPGPDLIVCDEGHRIKNAKAAISKSLKEIKTKRRIVLTGYPLQNNLLEYWCMVDFVRPGYLGIYLASL
jgi:RAD54-like protein 2